MRTYLFIGLLVLFAHLCLTKNLKKNSLAKVNSSSSSQDWQEDMARELAKAENGEREAQIEHERIKKIKAEAAWKKQASDQEKWRQQEAARPKQIAGVKDARKYI